MGNGRDHDDQPVAIPPCGEDDGAWPVFRGFLAPSRLLRPPEIGVTNDQAWLGIGEGHRFLTGPTRDRTGR